MSVGYRDMRYPSRVQCVFRWASAINFISNDDVSRKMDVHKVKENCDFGRPPLMAQICTKSRAGIRKSTWDLRKYQILKYLAENLLVYEKLYNKIWTQQHRYYPHFIGIKLFKSALCCCRTSCSCSGTAPRAPMKHSFHFGSQLSYFYNRINTKTYNMLIRKSWGHLIVTHRLK